jgi:hypothetical protein
MRTLTLISVTLLFFTQTLFSQVARDKVVVELFTGVNCPYCPAAANGIKDMLDAGLDIAPIAIHTSSFSPSISYYYLRFKHAVTHFFRNIHYAKKLSIK